MFEVGSEYEFRMLEAGDDITFRGTVELYNHPLIKLRDTEPLEIQIIGVGVDGEAGAPETIGTSPAYPGRIINITSTAFVQAQQVR